MSKQSAVKVEIRQKRELLAATVPDGLKVVNIQFMGMDDLLRMQQHFGLGDTWGVIEIPQEWLRPSESARGGTYYLYDRLRSYANSDDDLELAVMTLLRMVLLTFCAPSKVAIKHPALLDIGSIRSYFEMHWIRLVKAALTKPPQEDGALLARLDKVDVPLTTDGQNERIFAELKRFEDYGRRGLWWDSVQDVSPTKTETTNKKPKRESEKQSSEDPYKPLPDEFVLQTGKRAAWMVQQLIPQVLHVYGHVLKLSEGVHTDTAKKRAQKYLRNLKWDLGDHDPLGIDPYPLNLYLKPHHKLEWPPQDRDQLIVLLKLCQTAAYFIVALSAGPRASEVLSLNSDCLSESRQGIPLANGRTYKLSLLLEGESRDWPLPAIALQAIQQQIELVKLIDQSIDSGESVSSISAPLWRIVAPAYGFGNPLNFQYNEYLRDFAERVKTSHLLDQQQLTNHRFRKTIARLVALALVNAPLILMDIFGHKSLEMTMHYILTDKALRAEIEQIQKEILAMTVQKAIENVESNGGPAAKKIKAAVKQIQFVRSREDLEAEDIHELVVRMTSVGREWTIVAPGIICTKMRDQVGPCALGRSAPNTSKCSSKCDHRLEEPDNMAQANITLDYIVKNLQVAQAKNDFLAIDAFEGQLLTQIGRFDVLYEKWSEHPAVAPVLARS